MRFAFPVYKHILVDSSDGVARITLNRPERLNALGSGPRSNRAELLQALQAADADDGVGCLLLDAAGSAFCGGGDLTSGKPRETALEDFLFLDEIEQFHADMRALHKPMVASVHGMCLGAGMALIATCDLVVASEDARFGLVEGRIGLSGASHIVHLVGAMWASYLMFTGEMIDVSTAQRIGLVLEVVPDDALAARSLDLAQRIAAVPREAAQLNKAAIDAGAEAGGRAAGRRVASAADALTTAMARLAKAPDGRRFKDILRDEGLEGIKRARDAQYRAPWLAPFFKRNA